MPTNLDGSIGNIMDYGAKADGVTDDLGAFNNCLAANLICYLPPGRNFAISGTIQIPAGRAIWCPPSGLSRATIYVKFGGLAIQMNGNHPALYGVTLAPYGYKAEDHTDPTKPEYCHFTYDGVGVNNTRHAVIRDVMINYPHKGIVLIAGVCHWCDIEVSVFEFYNTGIDFSTTDPKNTFSNNNFIRIVRECSARLTDYPTWPCGDTYGIRMHGGVNTIIGGEIGNAKYAIDDQGSQNRWIGQYVENSYSIKVGPGAHYFDCHLALDAPPIIDREAVVVGQSGFAYAPYCHFERPQASASELAGLWYFDEIVNGVILDQSGHGKHLAVGTVAQSFVESPYGKALVQDPTKYQGTHNVPLDICDWTRPFTVVFCCQINSAGQHVVLSWEKSGAYTRIVLPPGNPHLQDYPPFVDLAWSGERFAFADATEDGFQKWCWLGMYIDPVAGRVKLLDSWKADITPQTVTFKGGLVNPTSLYLFDSMSGPKPQHGAMCFLAFWQRELTLPEFIALINQRTHWQPTPRSQATMKQIELIGADGAGRRILYDAAAPTTGTWRLGDIVYNTTPVPGGHVGWVCVAAGPPATWKPFGAISP